MEIMKKLSRVIDGLFKCITERYKERNLDRHSNPDLFCSRDDRSIKQ